MKILMINHFPLAGSGSGTYTRNLAVHLAAAGHEVTVILPENTEDYERIEGVRIHPVFFTPVEPGASKTDEPGAGKATEPGAGKDTEPGAGKDTEPGAGKATEPGASKGEAAGSDGTRHTGTTAEDALPFNFPCFTTHPRSTMSFGDLTESELGMYKDAFSRAINNEIENRRPDIIHGQHVWILPDLASGHGIPIVLTAHGTDLMGFDKWPEMRRYADHVIKEAARVISISKDNLDLLNEMFPEYREKFVRIKNGYDPGVFYREDLDRSEILGRYGITEEDFAGRRVVCFAGKLTGFKGVDILLDAAGIIEQKHSLPGYSEKGSAEADAEAMTGNEAHTPEGSGKGTKAPLILIVGDGEERDALRGQEEALGLKNVRFLGSVDQNELRRIYNVSDIDVVPSRREPFGLVAIEAMACGLPVVASDQGGLPDFVNDEVGSLAKPEDPKDLAEKIEVVLRRLDDADTGEAGRTDFDDADIGEAGRTDFDDADAGEAGHTAFDQKAAAREGSEAWRKMIASYARDSYAQDKIIMELESLYEEVTEEAGRAAE